MTTFWDPNVGEVAHPVISSGTITSPTVTTPAISGGTVDNAVIGGTTAAAGTFTTVTAAALVSTGFVDASAGDTISAAGTTRADATALTKAINHLTTVAASTGVILPASATVGIGGMVLVVNDGASAAKVYAAGSDTIDGTAGTTGVTLTNAKRSLFVVVSAGKFSSMSFPAASA